jgi:hypothetical protein
LPKSTKRDGARCAGPRIIAPLTEAIGFGPYVALVIAH